MARYIVTAGAVVAKTDSDTGEGYFFKDALLPPAGSERVKKDQERLLELGLIAEAEVVEVAVVVDPVDPTEGLDLDGLKAYAVEHGVDLGRATTEDGIRTKILDARPASGVEPV